MLHPHLLQDREEKIGERRVARSDMHAADAAILAAPHRGEQTALGREDGMSVIDQVASRRRGVGAVAEAVEQPDRHAAFKLADLQADPGLGEAQPPGRGREAAQLDDFDEGAEVIEIEAAHSARHPLGRPRWRRRRCAGRLDPLGDEFLQAPEDAVLDPQFLEMRDGL